MQLAQLYPDRITVKFYKQGDINKTFDRWMRIKSGGSSNKNSMDNLKKNKTKLELSKSSKRNIINSINSLYYHSNKRNIRLSSGKYIYGFKASFITLTLPSKQVHSDVEIKERLNVFLQVLRTKYEVNNYVWKAELQANENIHFHLIIDKYINYNAIKYYWNKAIKPLGYIDKYANKFGKMKLSEYMVIRSGGNKEKERKYYQSYKQAYFKGKEAKWRSPNSVDVISIKSTQSLSYYMAKYLTKPGSKNEGDQSKSITLERIKLFGKIWARSQSLSRLKYINKIDYEEIREIIVKLKRKGKCIIDKSYDYCRIIYLRLENCPKWFIQIHKTMLTSMARLDAYPFPT